MTISIRRTSRAADSPGRYFDRVSLDPYYMHRRRTGRSTSTWVPAGPLLQHLSTPGNHLRPVELPEQQTRRDIPARARLRAADRFANRIFPVQLLERQTTGAWQSFSPSRPSCNFFCYHVGITFRSRSLVVFFQLRSVSCAPFTPAFADGVVQRSLALYLPCFVSLCSPVWPRAISHRSSSIFHHEPIILCPSAIAIVA